ncbi:MAG: DNA-processing protein DprA [Phycisphaerae bacterium]|nr:DNA-processing protein DprA [Phycisphaerae bacterium]
MVSDNVATEVCRKYLRLHLCDGIGAVRFGALLREFGDIDRVLGASVREMARVRSISDRIAERVARERGEVDVDREIDLAGSRGVRIVCMADADYPAPLRMMDDPPPCLYYRGTLQREDAVSMAVVGSRQCSRYGAEQADRFGSLLAGAGLTVVSGMARGIDSAAHRGALSAGGRTLAVIGCGLSYLYPPEATELAERIAASGAILSELPMSVAPDSKNFPPRNRIIAGLSLGVLVVEAARRSGALISAKLACEYNREVFAIPGRIDVASADGCNELIKSGAAKLVMKLEDIMHELGPTGELLMSGSAASKHPIDNQTTTAESSTLFNSTADESIATRSGAPVQNLPRPGVSLTTQEKHTLELLATGSMPIETLCDVSDLPPAQVAAALTSLQLKGLIRRKAGDDFERIG